MGIGGALESKEMRAVAGEQYTIPALIGSTTTTPTQATPTSSTDHLPEIGLGPYVGR